MSYRYDRARRGAPPEGRYDDERHMRMRDDERYAQLRDAEERRSHWLDDERRRYIGDRDRYRDPIRVRDWRDRDPRRFEHRSWREHELRGRSDDRMSRTYDDRRYPPRDDRGYRLRYPDERPYDRYYERSDYRDREDYRDRRDEFASYTRDHEDDESGDWLRDRAPRGRYFPR